MGISLGIGDGELGKPPPSTMSVGALYFENPQTPWGFLLLHASIIVPFRGLKIPGFCQFQMKNLIVWFNLKF